MLTCPENHTLLTSAGKVLTGVVSQGNNFIQFAEMVVVGDIQNGNTKTFSLTGFSLPPKYFFEIDREWYTQSGARMFSLDSNHPVPPPFVLPFQSIEFYQAIHQNHIFIGEFAPFGKVLALVSPGSQYKIRYFDFPEIPLEEVRVYEHNRNFFVKTRNALLFFYREGNSIEWLINGKILAFGETFALYESNGETWIADWNDAIIKQ